MNKLTNALLAVLVLTQVPSAFDQLRRYDSATHAQHACQQWSKKAKDAGVRRTCYAPKEGAVAGLQAEADEPLPGTKSWSKYKPVAVWRY